MSTDNIDTCAAFDALLPIPGLWGGMSIGSLNRVFALRCDEVSPFPCPPMTEMEVLLIGQEIIHYLQHVKSFWSSVVDNDQQKMAQIDLHTVEALQLKAPAASAAEARDTKGLVLSGEVFSSFSEAERIRIWERISTHDTIIPSLYTFFRDAQYLEACANALKQLVEFGKNSPTVRLAMKNAFIPSVLQGSCPVQTSESKFRIQPAEGTDLFELAYRQLWLFVMRHYPQLARETKSKKVIAKSNSGTADQAVLHNMASLSRKLGFMSGPAQNLLKMTPDRQIAREALLKARKPTNYRYDGNTFDCLIDKVVECFAQAVAHEISSPSEIVLSSAPKLKFRCGPPREETHIQDRPLMFLDRIQANSSSSSIVSSFYVRQSVYFAFFGKPSSEESAQDFRDSEGQESPLLVPIDVCPNNFSNGHDSDQSAGGRQDQHDRQQDRWANSRLSPTADYPDAHKAHHEHLDSRISSTSSAMDIEQDDGFLVQDDNHERQGSLSADREILPDAESEDQVEQGKEAPTDHAETRSILSDSIFDGSLSSGEYEHLHQSAENICQNSTRRSSSTPDFDEPTPRPLEEEHESSEEWNSQLSQVQGSGEQSSPSITDSQDTEEKIQDLGQDWDNLASEVLQVLHPLESGPEDLAPGLSNSTDAQAHLASSRPSPQVLPSDGLSGQNHITRDARAAKVITRFDFAETNQSTPEPTAETPSKQQGLDVSHVEGRNDPIIQSEPTDVWEDKQTNKKKPRGHPDRLDDFPAVEPTVAEFSPPSPGEEARLRRNPPENSLTITFTSFSKGKWHVTDRIQVDPDDPSEAQRVALKYARNQHARFYNRSLRLVAATQCVRAAMEDGSNVVLMSLRQDLKVTREKVGQVAEMLTAFQSDE